MNYFWKDRTFQYKIKKKLKKIHDYELRVAN